MSFELARVSETEGENKDLGFVPEPIPPPPTEKLLIRTQNGKIGLSISASDFVLL